MTKRHNAKGRSTSGLPFVALRHWMMDSPAWRSLSPQDRCVYVELRRAYNGSNNGWLSLSVRDGARRCRMNKDTVGKSLATLEDRGFIECVKPASFSTNSRRAAEWRLADERCDRTQALPTKAF